MPDVPLNPSQAAALRRARELASELTHLVAAVRLALAESPEADSPEPTLAPGEMRAAFVAAASGGGRRPRELFGG
jgi:hypothetical protein